MNIEHLACLLNSEYQVKISVQTILEYLLWFIVCEGEGNETAATVNNSNMKKEAGAGERAGRGKGLGVNEITNTTPFIRRSMNTTILYIICVHHGWFYLRYQAPNLFSRNG